MWLLQVQEQLPDPRDIFLNTWGMIAMPGLISALILACGAVVALVVGGHFAFLLIKKGMRWANRLDEAAYREGEYEHTAQMLRESGWDAETKRAYHERNYPDRSIPKDL